MNPLNDYNQKLTSSEIDMTKLVDQRLNLEAGFFPKDFSGDQAALSQRIGKLLALAAPSHGQGVQDIMDSKTFQQTLRRLQAAVQKRRSTKALAKHEKTQSTPHESRRQVLIATVGVQRAQQIIALIREIRVLRLRRRDLLGSRTPESHQPIVCGRGGCSANVYSLPKTSDGKLPKEVRDIFFNTAIVDALEKSSSNSFAKLPWDHLYAQGQKHVQAYRSWLRGHTSSE